MPAIILLSFSTWGMRWLSRHSPLSATITAFPVGIMWQRLAGWLITSLLCGIVIMALFMFVPQPLVALFINPGCIAAGIAQNVFPYYAIGIPFFILNVAIVGYCQSIERMKAAMTFVFLRGIGLLIPTYFLLPSLLETEGIWLSMPLAEILTLAIICYWRFFMRK